MKELLFVIQMFSYLPSDFRTPAPPVAAEVHGYGTLLIAVCQPGQFMTITPGDYTAMAGQDGVATIRVAAQAEGTEPYRVKTMGGSKKLNGNVGPNEALSGICP